jgi:hypothetical protein
MFHKDISVFLAHSVRTQHKLCRCVSLYVPCLKMLNRYSLTLLSGTECVFIVLTNLVPFRK